MRFEGLRSRTSDMPDTVVESVNALAKAVSENSRLDYHEVQVQLLGIVAAHPIQQNKILTTLDTLAAIQAAFLAWLKSHASCATKQDLREMEHKIMSAISDFAAKQTAFNDRQDAAVTDLQGDVQVLNDKITELQNSNGQITPEDQKLLDDITARADAITTKLEALDAL